MIPGEYLLAQGDIQCNKGKDVVTLTVVNTGDRPVQIGSHFHFFEVNKEMELDRAKAFGMRLNIPSGTAVRFEPGEEKEVRLVALSGRRRAVGFNNLVDGDTVGGSDGGADRRSGADRSDTGRRVVDPGSDALRDAAMKKAGDHHFKNKPA